MRKTLSCAALALFLMPGNYAFAAADDVITPELLAAYQAVLANPTDAEASLRYAEIAESLGQNRKALSAYERILLNHPGHPAALVGMQRVRRKMQPPFTKFQVEAGIGAESNPLHSPDDADSASKAMLSFMMRDERVHFQHRWRTDVRAYGDFYDNVSEINYGYFGGTFGPILDVHPRIAAQPFLGAGVSSLGGQHYYTEGTFGVIFEGRLEGAYQSVRVRGGYRDYGDEFTSDQGMFADISGKFSVPDLLSERDVLVIEPRLRWSGINGTGLNVDLQDVEPGKYFQWSLELGYYNTVHDWLTLGGGVFLGQTMYQTDQAPSGDDRDDFRVSPFASATFNNAFGFESDLKFEYRYETNDSNDPLRDYDNHLGTMTVVHRF